MRARSKTTRIAGLLLIFLAAIAAALCGLYFAPPVWDVSGAGGAGPPARLSPAEKRLAAKPANRPSVNLSGTWKLDLKASDPVDSLLQTFGRSYLERTIAARIELVQVLVQTEGAIEIEVQAPLVRRREKLRTDGSPTTILDMQGKPIETISRWSADGKSLVTHATSVLDGKPLRMRTERWLGKDGNTLEVVVELSQPDGPSVRVHRVFRRLPNEKKDSEKKEGEEKKPESRNTNRR